MDLGKGLVLNILMNSVPLYAASEFQVFQKLSSLTGNMLPEGLNQGLITAIIANSSKYVSQMLYEGGIYTVKPWYYEVPDNATDLLTMLAFDTAGYFTLYYADAKGRLDDAVPLTGEVADALKLSTIVTVNDLIMSAVKKSGLVNKAYGGLEKEISYVL